MGIRNRLRNRFYEEARAEDRDLRGARHVAGGEGPGC